MSLADVMGERVGLRRLGCEQVESTLMCSGVPRRELRSMYLKTMELLLWVAVVQDGCMTSCSLRS